MAMKVLVAEKINPKGLEVLMASDLEVDVRPKITQEELMEVIADYDGLIVRSQPKVTEEVYQVGKNLKVVGRAGNGVDNIDMNGATRRGIIVVNTPDANSISAAEHTIGLLISSIRNIPQANASLHRGEWGRSRFQGVELNNKTLGIIGLGRIGTLVCKRMRSFGMRVLAYDPYISDNNFKRAGAEKCETLEEMIPQVDFLTIHTPKNAETIGMMNVEQWKLAKRGIRVVNCARGGLYDEAGLAWALEEGIVASAAVDVLVQEPCTDSPLYQYDNLIVTPHLGATTVEAQEKVGETIANEVIAALHGKMVPNAVNLPSLQSSELATLQPYLQLAEVLGRFYHQQEKAPVERVEIIYGGATAQMETNVLTVAVLKGLFQPIMGEQVNYVNARLVAAERGVSVMESTEDNLFGTYLNLIKIRVFSARGMREYAGTVFGRDDVRIVDINGFRMDVAPASHMVVIENHDVPGVIGRIGTIMGTWGINIDSMRVGKQADSDMAMMMLGVDREVEKDVVKEIMQVEGVHVVTPLVF